MKNLLILLMVSFFTTNLYASDMNEVECTLKVGYDEAKPFHYTTDSGEVVGLDAEILIAAADKIDCKLKFIEMPWARTLKFLKDGTIDVAIGASFKDNRAQWAYYSIPYKSINHWLYTKKNNFNNVNSIESFFNQKLMLGVVSSWAYPVELRRVMQKEEYRSQVRFHDSFEQLPKLLSLDRIDGIIAIPTMLKNSTTPENLSTFIFRAKYKEQLHFMFSKHTVSAKVIADFNNTLYHIIYSGQRDKIIDKYERIE